MSGEWINDGENKCNTCGMIFKVYELNNEPMVGFCPNCGSSNIEPVDEEE